MFNPDYLSIADGNLGAVNSKAFPKEAKYVTLDNISTVSTPGFFPSSTGLTIGDVVKVFVVDNLDPNRWTTVDYFEVLVVGA